MKKIVMAVLGMGLLFMGLWCTVRRRPGTLPPPAEETQMAFRVEAAARGSMVRYSDPQMPLRSLRWLPPLQGGFLVAQVVTQSDRQQISLFKDGTLQGSYLVPKPEGVRDGFFRLAELRDARVVDDVAVLLYAAPGSDEPPLLLALDLKTKDIRWTHRAFGERLAPAEGVIFLFGIKVPPVRLPLALTRGERTSPTGLRSAAKTIPLPMDILEIADLKPTGAWTFLLAHRGGLSAYRGSKGWLHHSVPEGDPGLFQGIRPALCREGQKYWWQPFPGRVVQVLADGTPKATWPTLPTAVPFARDADLLHLLGAAGDGKLWFDLCVPSPPPVPAQPADSEGKSEAPTAPGTQDWTAYVSQGLDRLYCWDPQKKVLQCFQWSALAVPPGFLKPKNGLSLAPDSGLLLLENGPSAWLLPLSALPLGATTNTGKAAQAK